MKLESQATLVSSRSREISWAAIFALVERGVNSKENEVKLMAPNPSRREREPLGGGSVPVAYAGRWLSEA